MFMQYGCVCVCNFYVLTGILVQLVQPMSLQDEPLPLKINEKCDRGRKGEVRKNTQDKIKLQKGEKSKQKVCTSDRLTYYLKDTHKNVKSTHKLIAQDLHRIDKKNG